MHVYMETKVIRSYVPEFFCIFILIFLMERTFVYLEGVHIFNKKCMFVTHISKLQEKYVVFGVSKFIK